MAIAGIRLEIYQSHLVQNWKNIYFIMETAGFDVLEFPN